MFEEFLHFFIVSGEDKHNSPDLILHLSQKEVKNGATLVVMLAGELVGLIHEDGSTAAGDNVLDVFLDPCDAVVG